MTDGLVRRVKRTFLAGIALAAFMRGSASAAAQAIGTTAPTNSRFATSRDAEWLGVGLILSTALTPMDARIARWTQSRSVQGTQRRHDFARHVTKINETTLTLAALATYAGGRLARQPAMADIGLHTTESIVLTSVISQLVRGPLGRSRPSYTHDADPYDFHFMKGFGEFTYRAFPSLHSSTAFAAGAALVGEVRERRPASLWYAGPLIYGAAALPGLSRMYLDQHWASDVVMGAFVGIVLGTRVVNYSHSHADNRFDHALLDGRPSPMHPQSISIGLNRQF